jgi:hypothetical protein
VALWVVRQSRFVGRLAERPEFRGMRAGALASLRGWDDPTG